MDTGEGTFREIPEEQFMAHPPDRKFQEGMELEILGSRFRVQKIRRRQLVLKLLPSLPQSK